MWDQARGWGAWEMRRMDNATEVFHKGNRRDSAHEVHVDV